MLYREFKEYLNESITSDVQAVIDDKDVPVSQYKKKISTIISNSKEDSEIKKDLKKFMTQIDSYEEDEVDPKLKNIISGKSD